MYVNSEFKDFLIAASPEILWFDVLSENDYSGKVFALGVMKDLFVVFEGYYGSCSGCGAWGEGGEPTNLDEVKKCSSAFWAREEAVSRYRDLTGMGWNDVRLNKLKLDLKQHCDTVAGKQN